MNLAVSSYPVIIFLLAQAFALSLLFERYLIFGNLTISGGLLFVLFVIVVSNVVLSFVILKKLSLSEYHDLLLQQQTRHIRDMQELMYNIRAQRHDFINHLQAVYGLLQLNKPESAQSYLAEVVQEMRISNEMVKLKQPEVSALIQRKASQALEQNIGFKLSVQSDLRELPVRPYNLNRILGNLIDNAFEAVMDLEPDGRFVRLEIGEDEKNYVFTVQNAGPAIDPAIQEAIFEPSFSTKGENRGLGLSITREIVKQHGGEIKVTSPPTVFKVSLPKSGRKEQ